MALITLGVVGIPAAQAQEVTWIRRLEASSSDAIGVSATASAVYVAGRTDLGLPGQTPAGETDAFVRKYDLDGRILWTRQFGTSSRDIASSISATPSAVFVAGSTKGDLPGSVPAGDWDAFVLKYDHQGQLIWARQFGTAHPDLAQAVSATSAGVFVAGATGAQAFVRAYDHDGNETWTREFGTGNWDEATSVTSTAWGIYVGGYTDGAFPGNTTAGDRDAFVRKYDYAGDEVWTRQFGSVALDTARSVAADYSGVYIAGGTGGTLPGQTRAGGLDAFVRKYDHGGDEVWTRQFGTASLDLLTSASVAPSGLVVAGHTDGALTSRRSAGDRDGFVRKYHPGGQIAWTRQFGTDWFEEARGIAATALGTFVVGETFGGSSGLPKGYGFVAFFLRYQPDALISFRTGGGYTGDGVVNATGSRQTLRARIKQGTARTFFVRAQNDGEVRGTFRVKGCGNSSVGRVTYLAGTKGSTDITAKVVAGTYRLRNLDPGTHRTFRMKVAIKEHATVGGAHTCKVLISSAKVPFQRDAVVGKLKAARA